MNKSKEAFRTITETAEILELPAHVLRFWESKFKYIKPMKRGGGRRYYRPEDINLLLGIKYLLYSEGLTIKGAQKVIQTNGVKSITQLGAEKVVNINITTKKEEQQTFKGNGLRWKIDFNTKKMILARDKNNEVFRETLEHIVEIRDKIKNRYRKMVVA